MQLGELLSYGMKQSGPVKGKDKSFAQMQEYVEKTYHLKPEQIQKGRSKNWFGNLPGPIKPLANILMAGPMAIASLGKLFTGKKEEEKPASYRQRATEITRDLQLRGYDNDDIQRILTRLGKAYDQESFDVTNYPNF